MTRRTAARRPGYTLLEILIASVIGLMLMAALYAAFSLVITDTSIGRDLTAESDLSRGIINRVGIDLGSPVGMLPPKSGGNPGASGGSTPTSEETTPTTTSPTTTGTDGETTTVVAGTDIPFQAGLIGTETQLVVFLSRSPDYLRKRGVYDPAVLLPSDVVKVTYYMHSSGRGLCRQERSWATRDGVWNSIDPDRSTEKDDLIAPEVVAVRFEFASGTGYISSWDGAASGTDGATNTGPPRAVKMTFTLELPVRNGEPVQKEISHVYPIRASIGAGSYAIATPSTGTTPSTGGQ